MKRRRILIRAPAGQRRFQCADVVIPLAVNSSGSWVSTTYFGGFDVPSSWHLARMHRCVRDLLACSGADGARARNDASGTTPRRGREAAELEKRTTQM